MNQFALRPTTSYLSFRKRAPITVEADPILLYFDNISGEKSSPFVAEHLPQPHFHHQW